MRNTLGSLLALIGAAATLVSPWQAWYNSRHGSSFKFYEVFGSGITVSRSGIMDSVFLVFLLMAILTLVGVLMRSRALVTVAAVVAFGFTILWMIRQGQAAGELTVTGENSLGLGSGLAWAFAGSLAMLIGSFLMTGRPRRAVVSEAPGTVDRSAYGTASATAEPSAISTTAPADKHPTAAAPTASASERTGTERLSKEEREMLGLDQDATTQPKKQN